MQKRHIMIPFLHFGLMWKEREGDVHGPAENNIGGI